MLYDRVEQTTSTTGTGTLSLIAPTDASRRGFVQAAGSGKPVFYCIETIDGLSYEYGYGTVTAGTPDTLTRTPIVSSNSNGLVNFGAGTKRVYSTLPASRAIVARAWCTFAGATGSVIASQNIASVTRNAAGVYTIAFAAPLFDGGYACAVTADASGGQYGFAPVVSNGGRSASQVSVRTFDSAGAGFDFPLVNIIVFGS
ncbi:hypothetical protein [Azospirillum thermophilum]|uniref:hypothetical protein n=1 Tax=Azospirillum thermophilum TaxID=2202148 RepID=UPI0015E89935|nr:hypothetical protein [Azospirillum thermophilum]